MAHIISQLAAEQLPVKLGVHKIFSATWPFGEFVTQERFLQYVLLFGRPDSHFIIQVLVVSLWAL